jgi:hypothetical protein
MRQSDRLATLTLEAQRRIFRLCERDYSLSLKAISLDSGIPYDTLRSYARRDDTAVMPVTAVLKLCDVVPDHLLSHLLDPVARHIASNQMQDGDLDELGREAADFTNAYVHAKSDCNITRIEQGKLRGRAERLASTAEKVAAA